MTALTGITENQPVRETSGLPGAGVGRLPSSGSSREVGEAASADFSKPAEFFNKLTQLKEKDPDKFMEVVSTMTEKLKSAAADYRSGPEGKMLSGLAAKFEEVANGGDVSQLRFPEPPGAAPANADLSDQHVQSGQWPLSQWLESVGQPPEQGGHMDRLFTALFKEVDKAN